jgi:polyphosphate kinase 2 (PPK2 family)
LSSRVNDIDLSLSLSHEESERRIVNGVRRLVQLRLFSAGLLEPHVVGPGLLVLFEGLDAAGKGGAIRHLTSGLDPRHVRVVPIGPPSDEDLRHHFLWRFQSSLPGRGQMTVYDRSWYGRMLVERVDGLIDEATLKISAREIAEFEQSLVNDGVTLVKFWLHVSDKEQLARFNDRRNDPLKHWKLTDEDWRNREKRGEYIEALEHVLASTDRPHAHWDLIAAENKHYARVAVIETLVDRFVHDLERHGFDVPEAHGDDYLREAPTRQHKA